ncbi:MAG: hypothetical protein J6R04_04470 [Clostridia bacterium]|nr:hypothetical protein [Clostridia bacterium]
MKNKLFNYKLYLEALKRLRIVGIAVAILCVSVSALIPIYHMANMARYDFYDVYGMANSSSMPFRTEAIENGALVIPALVASYLMPLFVFFLFSYLNKRNESDFYHAIPFTRGCVYTTTTLAALTWAWGILIASCLVAGALWAIDPYATFSFGGLLLQMLYMCLNTTLLISAANVAVSLMGTSMTSGIAFAIVLCLWRLILGLGMITIDEVNNLIDGSLVLGGYLNPSFLLPVNLVMGEALVDRPVVLIYALLVSLGLFALGGWLYRIRRSETAGRSVAGKWLQILMRCLVTLPTALVMTYMLLTGVGDVGIFLILLVVTVLIFLLYELLTTRSVRRMIKATPWLCAVLAACVVFGGAIMIGNAIVNNEDIPAQRITAVGLGSTTGVGGVELSLYEHNKLGDYMTKNDEAAAIVAEALKRAQDAERNGTYYYNGLEYMMSSSYAPATFGRSWVDIRLVGGMTVTRRVMIEQAEYARLIEIIREEADLTPIPTREEVKHAYVRLFQFSGYDQDVSGDTISALLPIMEQEWRAMDDAGKSHFISYNKYDGSIELRMSIRFPGERYDSTCYYFIDPDDMPRSYALLSSEVIKTQPSRERVKEMIENISKDADGVVRIAGINGAGKEFPNSGYFGSIYYADVVEFLLSHLDDMVTVSDPVKGLDGLTVLHIIHEGYTVYEPIATIGGTEEIKTVYAAESEPYVEPISYGYNDFVFVLDLDKDEQDMLWALLDEVGMPGEIDDKY